MRYAHNAVRRRVWDSGAGRDWVDVPVWTLDPPVLPTKTPISIFLSTDNCEQAEVLFINDEYQLMWWLHDDECKQGDGGRGWRVVGGRLSITPVRERCR